jgi:hypothetical protein
MHRLFLLGYFNNSPEKADKKEGQKDQKAKANLKQCRRKDPPPGPINVISQLQPYKEDCEKSEAR